MTRDDGHGGRSETMNPCPPGQGYEARTSPSTVRVQPPASLEFSETPSRPVLVLGLGNDILTDDAVGLHVAEETRALLADEPDIEVRRTTEMGLALLDEIAGREAVVIVDAVQTGASPVGTISERDACEYLPARSQQAGVASAGSMPHFLGVPETLAFGRLLGLAMPGCVTILAIEVADPYSLGTEPTPAVAAVIMPAARRAAAMARAFAATRSATPSSR